MTEKKKEAGPLSTAEIAREAFRRLALRRIAPTPDAYRQVYEEVAGSSARSSAELVLEDFISWLGSQGGELADVARPLAIVQGQRDWQEVGNGLRELVTRHLSPLQDKGKSDAAVPARPRGISLVDDVPGPARPRTYSLTDDALALPALDTPQARTLRDLLVRTLTLAVATLLQDAPELAEAAEALAKAIREARTEQALVDIGVRLKQLCFKIEQKSGDMAEERELLLRLFKLLLENVHGLVEDDTWISGQINSVQTLLTGPLNHGALLEATRRLKEVVYKQASVRDTLMSAKATMRSMMLTFIDRLGVLAASTGNYHEKIGNYSRQISAAKDIGELNRILDEVMKDTRIAQTEALRSRDEMISARNEAQETESRILQLESQLAEMNELVREDQLTGSLNRRGLEDVYEREAARAERQKAPLCIALLDVDDFKRVNDTHGHGAGDEVLIHLVRVVKDTLRSMDMIGRFGGEEFMIVLPNTSLEEAMQTITRLQRELTKRIFMHDNERLLITFSAGVALRAPDEDQASLVRRADKALYQAKRAGKNRVVSAG